MAKALVACETSSIMRRALLALGHDVWSCDLAPAEDRTNRHIICDVRDGILNEGWDLLAVMHRPARACAALVAAGCQALANGPTPRSCRRGAEAGTGRARVERGAA